MSRFTVALCTIPFHHSVMLVTNPSVHHHSGIAAVWIRDMGIIRRMDCKLTSLNHKYLSLTMEKVKGENAEVFDTKKVNPGHLYVQGHSSMYS